MYIVTKGAVNASLITSQQGRAHPDSADSTEETFTILVYFYTLIAVFVTNFRSRLVVFNGIS